MVAGVSESVRKEWSGDVDLNDGRIKQMHDTYLNRLRSTRGIGLGRRMAYSHLQQDLAQLEMDLTNDISFLSTGDLTFHRHI